ncbi:hypothetical protein EYY99_20495 [Hafnia alvei]|nr:hypothetical protein EYY99_20495 [Hafnia alvei]
MTRHRAWRRHHATRLKSKRKKYHIAVVKNSITIGKIFRTPCACSCYFCGKQRFYHGKSIQEIRAEKLYTD